MPSPQAHAPHSRRRRWRVPEARAALDALEASGLSVSAFAEREGVDEERLRCVAWTRLQRFRREIRHEAMMLKIAAAASARTTTLKL